MDKEKILDEILKLGDAAWATDEDIKQADPAFRSWYKMLVAKRKYLDNLLKDITTRQN